MDENQKKRRKAKNKNRKRSNRILKIILILIVVILFKLIFSNKNKDLKLILDYVDKTSDLSHELIKVDDIVYMSMEDISKYIDKTIYREDNLIISTSDFKVASMEIDSNVININGSEQVISGAIIMADEIVYLPISELEKVYNIKFKYSNSSNSSIIEDLKNKKTIAVSKKNISIKKEENIFSKNLSKVKKDEELVFISENEKWTKVMDSDGNIGFVKTNKLKNYRVEREKFELSNDKQDVLEEDIIEENITNEYIETFNDRKKLIEKIFTNAISNEKKYVKIFFSGDNPNYERLKIEARPIFNECGMILEFTT